MSEGQSDLKVPEQNAWIWRYVDLPKFISMLQHQSLFLSRADKFGDKFEGSLPTPYATALEEKWQRLNSPNDESVNILNHFREQRRLRRKNVFVNCWYVNQHESAAMWNLYGSKGSGIAVRSTRERLDNSLATFPDELRIGMVQYVDFEMHRNSGSVFVHELEPFFLKRKSFEHENELRIVLSFPNDKVPDKYLEDGVPMRGIHIPSNMDILIEKIFVHPESSGLFADVVKDVAVKYGLQVCVSNSSLNDDPRY